LGFTLLINGVANKRIGVSANRPLPAFKTQEITRILKHDTLIRLMLISGCEWRSVCEKKKLRFGVRVSSCSCVSATTLGWRRGVVVSGVRRLNEVNDVGPG